MLSKVQILHIYDNFRRNVKIFNITHILQLLSIFGVYICFWEIILNDDCFWNDWNFRKQRVHWQGILTLATSREYSYIYSRMSRDMCVVKFDWSIPVFKK